MVAPSASGLAFRTRDRPGARLWIIACLQGSAQPPRASARLRLAAPLRCRRTINWQPSCPTRLFCGLLYRRCSAGSDAYRRDPHPGEGPCTGRIGGRLTADGDVPFHSRSPRRVHNVLHESEKPRCSGALIVDCGGVIPVRGGVPQSPYHLLGSSAVVPPRIRRNGAWGGWPVLDDRTSRYVGDVRRRMRVCFAPIPRTATEQNAPHIGCPRVVAERISRRVNGLRVAGPTGPAFA